MNNVCLITAYNLTTVSILMAMISGIADQHSSALEGGDCNPVVNRDNYIISFCGQTYQHLIRSCIEDKRLITFQLQAYRY